MKNFELSTSEVLSYDEMILVDGGMSQADKDFYGGVLVGLLLLCLL